MLTFSQAIPKKDWHNLILIYRQNHNEIIKAESEEAGSQKSAEYANVHLVYDWSELTIKWEYGGKLDFSSKKE